MESNLPITILRYLEQCYDFSPDDIDSPPPLVFPPGSRIRIVMVVEEEGRDREETTLCAYVVPKVSTPQSRSKKRKAQGFVGFNRTRPISNSQPATRSYTSGASATPQLVRSRVQSKVEAPRASPSLIPRQALAPVLPENVPQPRISNAGDPKANIVYWKHDLECDEHDADRFLATILESACFAQVPKPNPAAANDSRLLSNPFLKASTNTTYETAELGEAKNILVDFVQRDNAFSAKDVHAKLERAAFKMKFAKWFLGMLKGLEIDSKRKPRSKSKFDQWDVNKTHVTTTLDKILQIQYGKTDKVKAQQAMRKGQKGEQCEDLEMIARLHETRRCALKLWADGRNLCILEDCAGTAALMFAIIGPPSLSRYSMMSRFRVENKMIPGNDKLRRLLRLNRTIITALADRRVSHWRQTMQDLGLGLDWDPVVVQRGEIFYRSSFNENTKSYEVGHFTAEQHKGYFINSSIGKGLSGVEDWETQTRHVEWHRCINCAIWKPPPLLVFDTEIPILGKGLLALQTFDQGDYIAEHAGVHKTADSMGTTYKDRLRFKTSSGIFYILQDNKWGMTKFVNHSRTPNAEWDRQYVSGGWRMMLVAKSHILAGTEVTIDYGPEYFAGSEAYNGPRLLSR